jgi:putative transposase
VSVSHKAFRFRVYPTPEQEDRLLGWENSLRWLWNLCLEQIHLCTNKPRCERRYLSAFDQINELTGLRAELPWLADVPRNVCAQLLVELNLAWQRCYRKIADEPRFKKKGCCHIALCEPHPGVWHIDGDTVIFPKLGALKAVFHRKIEGTPKKCSITRDVDQWFVSIVCEVEIPDVERRPGVVGIDRGVENLVADSNGGLVPNRRFLKQQVHRLRHASRVLSRRKKGSRNRKKAQQRLARLQRKVRRQRDYFLHQISFHYAESQGAVVAERLQVRSMTRSAKGTKEKPGHRVKSKSALNRSILDAGWTRLLMMLKYKLAWRCGILVEVPAAYSSQTCSVCEVVDARSRRSQSKFVCVSCGHEEHADTNAAKVVLGRGSHGLVCGGSAEVGRPVKQKLRVVRRGTRHGSGLPKAPAFRPG